MFQLCGGYNYDATLIRQSFDFRSTAVSLALRRPFDGLSKVITH